MKLAHLADIHLGFRQYHRLTPSGINQREADVAVAFRRAVDDVIAAEPDVVVVAGDLFHSVRPTNPAILHSFNQFRRLRDALPEAPVVIVAGDHDTPRSVETGSILRLFEALGIHVVATEARELVFDRLELRMLCVPYAALVSRGRPSLAPPRGAGRKVLVTHGEVAGVLPQYASALEYGASVVEPSELHAERWDYVALGHYHVAHRVRNNAWYAGALEHVSTNPWGELQDEAREGREGQKGWLLIELGEGACVTFRPIALARRFYDLPAIHGEGLAAAEIDAAIQERVGAVSGGIEHHVVRQVVWDVPRPVARDLDHECIRGLKALALHYHLDLRRPRPPREVGVGAPGTRRTLTDVLADYLSRRPLAAELDRTELLALGCRYMEAVEREALGE